MKAYSLPVIGSRGICKPAWEFETKSFGFMQFLRDLVVVVIVLKFRPFILINS